MTYLSDEAYGKVVGAISAACPLLDRDQIIDLLAARDIWPASSNDEAASVLRFRPAIIGD